LINGTRYYIGASAVNPCQNVFAKQSTVGKFKLVSVFYLR